MTWRKGLAILACGVGMGVVVFALARPGRRASGALTQEAYIWQRVWTGPVGEAVGRSRGRFASLVALCGEITPTDGHVRFAPVTVDYGAVRAAGVRVGLALRIGVYGGPFDADAPVTRQVVGICQAIVADARKAGVEPDELQIDFDCATSKLSGYRAWIGVVRERVRPLPVTFTALPSWLQSREFAALAKSADGFVLQVHSLERPGISGKLRLCDPTAARAAVERAARAGVPFRVALPTYGYVVGFAPEGKWLGISAEGPALAWPADAVLKEVRADPAELAALVQEWTASRPMNLRGISWYRLPVAADAMNWRWETLAAVMAGRAPKARLIVEVRRTEPQLRELVLVNGGDADAVLDTEASAECDEEPVAADAMAGFACSQSGRRVTFMPPSPAGRLAPGDRVTIGWIRLSADKEVRAYVETSKP